MPEPERTAWGTYLGEGRLIREAGREMVLSGKTLQNSYVLCMLWTSLVAQTVKRLPTMQETWIQSLGQEDPLEKEWQPTSVSLPGKTMDRGAWQATVHRVAKHTHTM